MGTILLIDDEESFSTVTGLLLETLKHTVIIAQNGRIGLDMAQNSRPDLIICDILMPGMSGFDVLSKLRNSAWGVKVPFIFLTGSINDFEKRKAMELGAKNFLQKPCGAEALFKVVDEALNSSGHCLRTINVL